MKYSTYCELTGLPSGNALPTVNDVVQKVEDILDYEFESPSLCHDALAVSKKQAFLAEMPSIPDFGSQDVLAAAAKKSGIASLFKANKKGKDVSDKQPAVTVKALLGAVMEDVQDENYVLQAAYGLGLEAVEETAVSMPILESLI